MPLVSSILKVAHSERWCDMKKRLKLGSLFDGIGGFTLAAQRCGIKTLWASEIEPAAISITKRHFPNIVHLGDITQIDGGKIAPVDIISFGSPCQDLSAAGTQKGLVGERSGLFLHAVRIINEMRYATNGKYPSFIIWENVPGAFNSNGGADFRAVIETLTKTRVSIPNSGKWARSGMAGAGRGGANIAWRQFDSQYWGNDMLVHKGITFDEYAENDPKDIRHYLIKCWGGF